MAAATLKTSHHHHHSSPALLPSFLSSFTSAPSHFRSFSSVVPSSSSSHLLLAPACLSAILPTLHLSLPPEAPPACSLRLLPRSLHLPICLSTYVPVCLPNFLPPRSPCPPAPRKTVCSKSRESKGKKRKGGNVEGREGEKWLIISTCLFICLAKPRQT